MLKVKNWSDDNIEETHPWCLKDKNPRWIDELMDRWMDGRKINKV